MEILSTIEYWHWIAFGAVLIIAEIFVPSAILLWPGIAAVAIGLINIAFPQADQLWLLLIWGLASLALAAGWQFYRNKTNQDRPASTINRRGEQIVGRHFTLSKDIINGTGELHIDDTRWKIIADHDHSAGTKVKVVAVEGTSLRVEEYLS